MAEKAVVRHSLAVYDELRKRATEDPALGLVFEGRLRDVFSYLSISSSQYTRVRRVLLGCGSIVYLQRGSRYQPSIIGLTDRRPDGSHMTTGEDLTGYTAPGTILREIGAKVEALVTWRESLKEVNLAKVLQDFEKRVSRLEEKLYATEAKSGTTAQQSARYTNASTNKPGK